jgi:hypothetical protein
MATAGRLREALKQYKDDEPLLWQFWSAEHADIPEDHFQAITRYLQDSPVFLEELHELLSEWVKITYRRMVSDGDIELSYGELADFTHAKQVEFYEFCTCEDGPKVYDDCTQDGKL